MADYKDNMRVACTSDQLRVARLATHARVRTINTIAIGRHTNHLNSSNDLNNSTFNATKVAIRLSEQEMMAY